MGSITKWGTVAILAASSICVAPTAALSDIERDAISQNCSTIQQTLGQLQKIDSRTRTYLGTTYETIFNKFITPLNLRLVKNNLPTLSALQTEFSIEQAKFRDAYTNYMRDLEALIAIDCRLNPDGFYEQLILTRAKREDLRESTAKLTELAEKQYRAVTDLRASL